MAPNQQSPPARPAWHGLAAGSIAGASGVLIGHAFDTAKVQAQVGKSSLIRSPGHVLELYRGVLPPLLTTGAMRSLYFGVYEAVRPAIAHSRREREDELATVFLAGGLTGLLTAPVTAPMQRLKLVQQMAPLTIGDTVRRLLRGEGVRGLFRGLGLHCTLEMIGSAAYLVAYSAAKRSLRRLREASDLSGDGIGGQDRPPVEPLPLRILCGMAAGCAGWLSIYPLDVLRSRIMSTTPPCLAPTGGSGGQRPSTVAAPPSRPPPQTLVAMVDAATRETYASGGMRGFYRGIGFTLLRAAPVAGVVLPVYDALLARLDAPDLC